MESWPAGNDTARPPRLPSMIRALERLGAAALRTRTRVSPAQAQALLDTCRARLFRLLFRLAAADRRLINPTTIWDGIDADLPQPTRDEVVAELRDETSGLAGVPPEELGRYLPDLLDLRIRFDDNGCELIPGRQRRRKETGSYFTPPDLIEQLLDRCWQPLLCPSRLHPLRVGDLACGVGHFLLAAGRRLVTAGLPRASLETQLIGVDISPLAATLCGMALALESGLDPDLRPESIYQADSLLTELPHTAPLDAVIGNPPWVSLTGRQRAACPPADRRRLIARYPAIARWPALHSAMLLRATELVRPGGRIGLVLPRQMADLEVYSEVRRQVSARAALAGPVLDVGESAFPGVTHPVGLFTFIIRDHATRGSPAAWPVLDADPATTSKGKVEPLKEVAAKLAKLPRFAPETFSDPGVHTGNAGKMLVRRRRPVGPAAPLRIGSDVTPFVLSRPRHWLRLGVAPSRRTYFTIRPLSRYRQVPIVLRQTANRPIAARHSRPTYFRNSVLACAGLAGLPHTVMVGLLNSALFAWLLRTMAADARQRTFPQVKVGHLRQLPAPPAPCRPSLMGQLDKAVRAAEAAAATEEKVADRLLLSIERLVLRVYGLPVSLAPVLIDAVRPELR